MACCPSSLIRLDGQVRSGKWLTRSLPGKGSRPHRSGSRSETTCNRAGIRLSHGLLSTLEGWVRVGRLGRGTVMYKCDLDVIFSQ